ncbi:MULTISPECIES: carboxymuconolactone decarboxylase family protein [Amycolatopsis]|uniref:Carboxymuconolactone decarboxylase family protein n=1 Tax=Amycolatopsis thermalba TaxID=944492 RepID=A0ABY4NWP0_9PSEU|nr:MULTISPECIES: carboxymuconolactone decarboxylase family protein [Amycolatopsis]OXM64301.1 alkylhydroperoxidase [Amycolatopsis sp. KNN50.9b]UQS24489.1 carboxymuconolactone decarboxylase family protein [Amycolatopsis thermalba]
MTTRMKNPAYVLPDGMKGIGTLLKAVNDSGLPAAVREFTGLRVSQINGCAACVYGHVAEARKAGETDERIFNVAAWREAPFYSDAERAALELAEHATRLADLSREGVPDRVWDDAADHFDERQLSGLILAIALTNLFNRINVTIKEPAGTTW